MLYIFISCVPLFLLSRFFTLKTLQLCDRLVKILSFWLRGEFSRFLLSCSPRKVMTTTTTTTRCSTRADAVVEPETVEEEGGGVSLLDLPDLALDLIFERLSPTGLRAMAGVCSSLREQCTSDHLWERHLREKWGPVIGESARREWQCQLASNRRPYDGEKKPGRKSLFESVVSWRLLSWVMPRHERRVREVRTKLPADSIMAWYLSFESGKFWFPAQVYNRENGHIGFMLSCYDAHLCYDSSTDTFEARYSPHGRRTAEDNIEWDRLRASPVETNPLVLHVSDCLQSLKPGDHVEIQWRRNKEFPYGWWYGTVAHLETCDGNENHCRCHSSDSVVLEFKQYNPGSRWRQTVVNRKDHTEKGNEVDGFYGGIRKLHSSEEIAKWNRFWPNQVLEQ